MNWLSKTPPSKKEEATNNREVLADKKKAVNNASTDGGNHGYACECQGCRMDRRREGGSSESVWRNGFVGNPGDGF